MPARPLSLARLLGLRVASLRTQLGITQEKLAWEVGLSSKSYMSRIENGGRIPSIPVLERIAKRLDVEVRDLFIFPNRGAVDEAIERVRREGDKFAKRVLELGAEPRK